MARRTRRAPPLRRRHRKPPRRRGLRLSPIMVMAPLALLTGLYLAGGGPASLALDLPRLGPAAPDVEQAQFAPCAGPVRVNCVVDGDTFWYRGEKIRLSDINAPEVSKPGCAGEAALGARATDRLLVLLNQGAFTLEPQRFGPDRDKYGRLLREVTRDGDSLGDMLVREGVAERWKGYRGNWC